MRKTIRRKCEWLCTKIGGNIKYIYIFRDSKKNALYLSVNVFSTEVLIGDTILTSPTGDGTAILRGHPSHAKV